MTIFRTVIQKRAAAFTALVSAGLSAACIASAAHAAEPALVQGPQGTITAQDMMADATRMPEEMRGLVLSRPNNVQQIATGLYIRRAMAQEATKLGLGKAADVQAALQVAQDKVLSDAYLEKLTKESAPSRSAAEAVARNIYAAKPESFKVPEQVRVRHILIDTKGDEGRAQAEKLLQEIKAGGNFAELAKAHSADKGSGAKGGDLGFFGRDRMAPEFEKAAFELKNPGDLSAVVPTQFGFHVLQLEARKPAAQQTFEEVREDLIKQVIEDTVQKARVKAADKIRAEGKPDPAAIEAFAASKTPAAKP